MKKWIKTGMILCLTAALCVSVCGCTKRTDLEDAYQLYDTTAEYSTLRTGDSSGRRGVIRRRSLRGRHRKIPGATR